MQRLPADELEQLAEAVTAELHRRDVTVLRPASQPEGRTPSPPRTKAPASGAAAPRPGTAKVTQAKVNAIRAALKAGVKPNTVARELGVSLAAIREALAEIRKK